MDDNSITTSNPYNVQEIHLQMIEVLQHVRQHLLEKDLYQVFLDKSTDELIKLSLAGVVFSIIGIRSSATEKKCSMLEIVEEEEEEEKNFQSSDSLISSRAFFSNTSLLKEVFRGYQIEPYLKNLDYDNVCATSLIVIFSIAYRVQVEANEQNMPVLALLNEIQKELVSDSYLAEAQASAAKFERKLSTGQMSRQELLDLLFGFSKDGLEQ